MYNKKKNLIFAGIIFVIIIGMMIVYKISKDSDDIDKDVNNETGVVDEEYQKIYDEAFKTLEEAEKNILKIRGGYKDRYDSREINPEFICNELDFIEPSNLVRVIFTGYEELENVSEYMDTDGTSKYLPYGMNEDGTFFEVTDVTQVRYGDLDYGEVVSTEETSLVGIKLKLTLENLKNEKNKVLPNRIFVNLEFAYLDDGKFYWADNVFHYDCLANPEPFYESWYDRYDHTDIGPTRCCNLEPKEKLECECIFLVYKNHFDNTYLTVTPFSSSIENFNNTLIKLIPFSTLKTLEEK